MLSRLQGQSHMECTTYNFALEITLDRALLIEAVPLAFT